MIDQEVTGIKSNINHVYTEKRPLPKFGFIVINKKTNTRIMQKNVGGNSRFQKPGSNNRNYENPLPGTVVDDVITLPER